ncbi:MAG TPA: hypothetical protein VEL75_00520, partial [Candidatus Methylomirabilis sp.]|nr:hypothetical protein [Candidatus Methylomirabilis sp.]
MRIVGAGLATLGTFVLLTGTALAQGYVYPAKGQSPQQQQQDEANCAGWAMQQSGVSPASMPPPPQQGQVVRGAGRGAAVG